MRIASLVLAVFTAITASAGPILNGDFESGNLTTGATSWTDIDSVFGEGWCDLANCGTGGGTAGPNSGNGWIWFGGTQSGQTATLSQSGITLSPGALLNFFLWIGATSTVDSTATLTLSVDSTQIFSASQADAALYATYQLVSLNLGALADGGDHTLTFNYSDIGGASSNFSLDDVSVVAGVPEPSSAALIGLGLVGLGFVAPKRRR